MSEMCPRLHAGEVWLIPAGQHYASRAQCSHFVHSFFPLYSSLSGVIGSSLMRLPGAVKIALAITGRISGQLNHVL
jgi:hypothetical protein